MDQHNEIDDRECGTYRAFNHQTHFIDSVVVDYKEKTFELMKKNTEL
jgi:hypothetical protein